MTRLNKRILRLLEPGLRLYFFFLLCFAFASSFFNLSLAAAEFFIVVALYWYLKSRSRHRQKEILQYIENVTSHVDTAAKETMFNSPLPMVIFRVDNEEIIWSNDRFLTISGGKDHFFEYRITSAVPGFSSHWLLEGKTEYPGLVSLGAKFFQVFGHMTKTTAAEGVGLLATTYWIDVTELEKTRVEYEKSRPLAAVLIIDNYEELTKGLTDNAKSSLLAEIDEKLEDWAAPADGLLRKYDRDRYLFLFEERYLSDFADKKFSLLDEVRTAANPNGISATVSIGIGKDAQSFRELYEAALLSLEMALSRGGDQAVIKNRINFEFYGGRAKETEKRSKVKSRVMANALGVLMNDASTIFIMGHRYPDLDSIGAAAGVCSLARKRSKAAYIVLGQENQAIEPILERLAQLDEYSNTFITAQDAIIMADPASLLIVVDTNRPDNVQSEELLLSCSRVAVIDHHRRAATYIADAALNFHEPYASSASELVAEVLTYLLEPGDILSCEAEALLAGIVLDTKSFTMRTGSRTFDVAAFLRRSGADMTEVKKMFQSDLGQTLERYSIVSKAHMYRPGVVIAVSESRTSRMTSAQAADELLNIEGIETSFVLTPEEDCIAISGRSMGDTNVQLILESLGGGGNGTTAGAQVFGKSMEEALSALKEAIDRALEQEDEHRQ